MEFCNDFEVVCLLIRWSTSSFNLEHHEISDLWSMKHKTTLWHKQSCCFAPENILRAIYRALCAPGVLWFSVIAFFLLFFLGGGRWGGNRLSSSWNSPRQASLCLLSPKMSKRTVLSAFLRLTRSSDSARLTDGRTDCF